MAVDRDDKPERSEKDEGATETPATPKTSKSEAKPEGTRVSTMVDVRGADKSSSGGEERNRDKLRNGT